MEEKNVKLVFDIDRETYDAFLFLSGQKRNEETEEIWEKMSKAPIHLDYDMLGEESQTVKFMMVGFAISAMGKNE